MTNEVHEQVEFSSREGDLGPVPGDRPARDIDDERAQVELCGTVRVAPTDPPKRRPDPGHELRHLERLSDVVVGTGLQPHHDVDGVRPRRQHDHRECGALTDGPADLEPIDAAA